MMLHWHVYEIVKVQDYIDTSYDLKASRTEVYKMCTRCAKVKSERISGFMGQILADRYDLKYDENDEYSGVWTKK